MNGNVQHQISLEKAVELTARFRKLKKELTAGLCLSETFSREAIESLLRVEGCAAVRIYYGMKEDRSVHAILVAADAAGNDILPPAQERQEAHSTTNAIAGLILEDGARCPPQCPQSSKLNSD